jgi:prepilin-type N-terminal cleavage/methylation domain-containing protein
MRGVSSALLVGGTDMQRLRGDHGFTLIELLVVIAITSGAGWVIQTVM